MIRQIFTYLVVLSATILHAETVSPKQGERVVLIGNGLGERMVDHPYLEVSLQLSYAGKDVVVRNLCRPGDTPGFRPHPSRNSQWAFPGAEKFHPQHRAHAGDGFYPSPDEWLKDLRVDTLIAFFGYNESFDGPEGLENFKGELDAWLKHTSDQRYNGWSAPRVVLVSPIAFENLSAQRDLPNGAIENANLALYTNAMREVAQSNEVEFVNVFDHTYELYEKISSPFTRNGFLPNDNGYKYLGQYLKSVIFGDQKGSGDQREAVEAAVKDKNWYWFNEYRMLNGVHVDGRRFNPFGPDNYPDEKKKIREMVEVRDRAIWAAAKGQAFDVVAADQDTHQLPEVKTNYHSGSNTGEYKYGEDALKEFTTPEGYKIELFASEKEFPNLANPMQMCFDNEGRLWVATMPTYPHYRPGDPKPNDKILIYEDTNGDGKADKETVFADQLHLPIGFELVPGGVYVSQEPHLIFMADTNGDGKADHREVVLTGFDSHDTHHAISAFTADPSGGIIMCEGVFLHSNVETAYGPVRGMNGGFFRFSPRKNKLERTSQLSIPNPWGFTYDEWGQDFFLYTSGAQLEWHLPGTLKTTYGERNPHGIDLVPQGHSVRPTSGLEFISSRHFPEEVQGDILIGNNIGFLGIKQHSMEDDGTGYKTAFRQDLLRSSDGNFRTADFQIAPDGSLYLLDWHNVLIGHMQHNARDPLRDHAHGRIYRITFPSRPLVDPAKVAGASIPELLENLKLPEYRSRYRSRRELRAHPAEQVTGAVTKWIASLDTEDPRYDQHLLEGMWVTWGANQVDTALVKSLLRSKNFHVRAAAVRALRYNFERFPDALDLLKAAAADDHGRVRMEAVAAATWYEKSGALAVVEAAISKGTDKWTQEAFEAAANRLKGWEVKMKEENPMPAIPDHLSGDEKKQFVAGHEIYHREGHCATCHQSDGKGLDPAFPPLTDSIYVHGDADRLIKLTLHGVMGPFEMNGKKYDGQVPMTPFGGMLSDAEIADVLTYVRNRFGNKAPAITEAQVGNVREGTKNQNGFYQMGELLKEHPLEE